MNIESRLHDLVGYFVGKIHTGKSSHNDQITIIKNVFEKFNT